MTEEERRFMQEHVRYWRDLADKLIAILFGPVIDPKGVYGIAIIEASNDNIAFEISENDPVIRAKLGFCYEIYPMSDFFEKRGIIMGYMNGRITSDRTQASKR
jgi:uncharacterized protein YciI